MHNQILSTEKKRISGTLQSSYDFINKKINAAKMILQVITSDSKVIKTIQSDASIPYDKLKKNVNTLIQTNQYEPNNKFSVLFVDKYDITTCISGDLPVDIMNKILSSVKHDSQNPLEFYTSEDSLFDLVYFCNSQQIILPSIYNVKTEYIGTFVIVGQINTSELLKTASFNDESYVYLANETSPHKNIVISSEDNSSKKIISLESQLFSDNDWKLVTESPLNFPITPLFIMFILEAILLPLLFIFIHGQIKYILYKPIDKIYHFLDHYSTARDHSRLKIKSKTEIGIIADKINFMLDNTEDLYRKIVATQQTLYEKELVYKETQLQALQTQISPHFLYNTLDCICGLANTSGVPVVADIVVSLSKLLRYSISETKEVAFGRELEFLEHYISIQSAMHPNRFDVNYDISNKTLSVNSIKMILQPIVENVFKHAFINPSIKYLLSISAHLDDSFLIVKVRDNGCGISVDKCCQLKKDLSNINTTFFEAKERKNHIGLLNIQYRIQLNYGKSYGIEIDSKENEYTEVIVRLPNDEKFK